MSDAAHWQYGGGPTGQPVEMQPGEFDAAVCTPPLFGQMAAQERGVPRVIQVQQPAAGADWVYKHSGPSWFIPTCIVAQLVTSAAAGNRAPRIGITFRSVTTALFPPDSVVAASLTVFVSASDAGGSAADPGMVTVELPDNLIISDGMTLFSQTANIQAADQYSLIAILCEEFSCFEWD